MNHRFCFFGKLMAMVLLVVLATCAQAAKHNKYLTGTQLARIEFSDRSVLMQIDELGGIIDNVRGDTAWAYLKPDAFDVLQNQGLQIRWMEREQRAPLDDYHNNDQIQAQFVAWQTQYPNLFHYESIGLTPQGRNMWVCKISDNVNVDEAEMEVRYIAAIHGDENLGTENCLRFAQDLLTNYGNNADLTELVNDFEIWMLPLFNPDGNAAGTRGNSNGVDMNRDFPDRIDDSVNTTAGREVEVGLFMNWTATRNFLLSANFHGGTVVCNYPFDGSYSGASVDTPTPEDALFEYISRRYSQFNLPMWNSSEFDDGITNGCAWYNINGGLQDWCYVWMGEKNVTIELSTVKRPPVSQLETFWTDNQLSMKWFLLEAKYGIRGIVTDSTTGLPIRAGVQLGTSPYLAFSSATNGDYYRILQNGTYTLTFSKAGYQSKTFTGITVSGSTPTILNVQLARTPSPVIATSPASISSSVNTCDSMDLAFSVVNNGQAALNWSAIEAYVNNGGYGSSTGGGWRFIDSDHTGGPAYNWVDISTRGTAVSFTADDQNLGPFAIGFNFPIYGSYFSNYRISANGWISFTSTSDAYDNTYLPSTTGQPNMIAAWWDDLSPQRSGTNVRRYSNSVDSLIVSYSNVQSYTGSGLYNFQIILLASGKIVMQYASMGTNRLTQSTIGLQNSTMDKGTTVVLQCKLHS